jgi:branched-chain amino acid transport system substrate-binding protein
MNKRRYLALGLAATATAALMAGCASRGAAESADSTPGVARTSCDTEGNSQGITDSTIKLGMFTPLTGPVADPGNLALEGFQFGLDQANADGGVQGRQVEVVAEDDQYDASVAQEAARRLETSEQVFAFAGGVGTPNFVAVLPYIKQNSIPSVGPYAPSNQVGVMENPDVFMIWPNFIDEYDVGMSAVMESDDAPETISFVQMVGDVGDDALTGLEKALDGTGVEIANTQSVEATTTDFTAIAQSLKNTDADMLVLIAPPVSVGNILAAIHQIGYEPRLFAQSDMTDESWLSEYASGAEGMVVPTKVAPLTSTDPKVQEFVTAFTEAEGHAPSMWNAAGYTQALITLEALEQSEALTRDCFELALETMDGFETGLIPPVTFGPDSRQGTNAVGVGRIEDGAVVELAPFQPVG